jgi:hypothetical protein
MAGFRWTKKAERAAISLAGGATREEAAAISGIGERTLYRWLDLPEFSEEVDRLTFLTGIAAKAERLRLAKRIVDNLGLNTEKDLLDWLKYVQGETDGIKLDIADLYTAIAENAPALATGRSAGDDRTPARDDAGG